MSIIFVKPRAALWTAAACCPRWLVPAARRGGTGTAWPAGGARGHVAGLSTRSCCSISRRKFCLCSPRPASASTACCNCSRVNWAGISSNTTGRYLILARSRAMPVARMRRWSWRMGSPGKASPRQPAPRGLGHQARLEQQLVALQHHVLVPGRAARERDVRALAAARARPDPRPPRTRRPAAARWSRPAARARRRAGLPRGNSDTNPASRPARRRSRPPRASGPDSSPT